MKRICIRCDNNNEFVECQSILFKYGFYWPSGMVYKDGSELMCSFPIVVQNFSSSNLTDLSYSIIYNKVEYSNYSYISINMFLRREKLERLSSIANVLKDE